MSKRSAPSVCSRVFSDYGTVNDDLDTRRGSAVVSRQQRRRLLRHPTSGGRGKGSDMIAI